MMQTEHVQIEYIPSPPVNRVVPRCFRNFCPSFSKDVVTFAKKDVLSLVLIVVASIWFIVDVALFIIGCKTENIKVWIALGMISTVIPAILFIIFTAITTCLYCGKIYRDSSEEITLEDHPDLRGTFNEDTDAMNDAFDEVL